MIRMTTAIVSMLRRSQFNLVLIMCLSLANIKRDRLPQFVHKQRRYASTGSAKSISSNSLTDCGTSDLILLIIFPLPLLILAHLIQKVNSFSEFCVVKFTFYQEMLYHSC